MSCPAVTFVTRDGLSDCTEPSPSFVTPGTASAPPRTNRCHKRTVGYPRLIGLHLLGIPVCAQKRIKFENTSE